MKNKSACYKLILFLLLLQITLNTLSVVFGEYSWDTPVEIPKNANAEEIEKIENFNEEIRLANKANDRNSIVEHMRKALSYRPNNPDNISIEYRIAVLLSQDWDPKNPQPLRREEALTIYENIIKNYKHMDYYDKMPADSIENAQLMVPRAAIHAACLTMGLHNDNLYAREYLNESMKCLKFTYEKRKSDILSETRPIEKIEVNKNIPTIFGGPLEREKFESQLKYWEQRQKDASDGNVLGSMEMEIVKAAVRQYGYTFGPRQKAGDVALAMGNIIRDFPGTPMAKIATEHIERAKEMM